jgi:RHS repeat-associated protein
MTYDALDRLKTITDANKATTTYDYDPNGNQILMTDALDRKWMSAYDTKNRLISRTDPLARISRMRYNTADEMTAMISPSGRTTTYGYDARGQRIEMKDPLGNTVRFTYDSQRNMTALTDQRGNTTTFSYDALDRIIVRRDPLGFTTTYEYDFEGNPIVMVDRLGRRTTVSYDELNRRKQVMYVDATVNYTYDRAGRLTNIADTQSGPIPITWAYDDANRLLSETTSGNVVVRYTYNNASQRASMTAADRPPVTYGYDTEGRLKTITQSAETFTYSYDKLSRVERLERPNLVKTEYGYDEVNRLKRLTHTNAMGVALEDFQYSFNADDEIEAIQSLASATLLPTNKSVPQANAANRIAQFGQAGLSFDNEGQTTTRTDDRGTAVYEWDARGRLKKVTMPNGQIVDYGYDTLGRRINRTADGATTNFVYDGQDVVLDRAGSSTVDYLNGFGIDNKLRLTNGGLGALYFLRDNLGSTAALVNGAGSLIERTWYEAFGVSASSSLTRYGFTSRELDQTTGLMSYRARWYDTQQGRFISEDPINFLGGLNLYEYVSGNPVTKIDPQGTCEIVCATIIGAIIVGGATIIGAIIMRPSDGGSNGPGGGKGPGGGNRPGGDPGGGGGSNGNPNSDPPVCPYPELAQNNLYVCEGVVSNCPGRIGYIRASKTNPCAYDCGCGCPPR